MTVQIHYQAPLGWELKSIASFVENYKGGASLTPDDFRESGFPVIPKKGVQEGGWLVIDEPTYCSESFAESNAQSKVASKHVVVTLRDLVPSGPSIGLAVRIQQGLEFILSQGTYGLEINEFINPDYFCALSNSQPYRKAMRRIMVGSTQVHIRTGEFLDQKFACPTILEQNKIAEILSTWDKSIKATERLLENSKKRKKALMQQLLTGKKRLPGFKQPWSTTKLSTLCEIRRGASPRPISDPSYFSDSGRGWVRISDVTSDETPFFRKTSQYLSPLGESKSVKVDDGDLIMSICATIGVPKFVKIPACIHDGFVVFRNPSDSLSLNLLYYVIQFITDKLDGEGQPGTQRNLNTSIVGEIQFPKITTEEQEMIAEIFKLADSSIGAINERLKSLRKEKDALMQQLLTGKKRVFTSEAI